MAPASRAPEISAAEIQAMADAVNDYVDVHFSASEHLPAELQKLVRPLEVATGQGALPVLALTAAAMAGVNNGANIQLWTRRALSATTAITSTTTTITTATTIIITATIPTTTTTVFTTTTTN
eukprot:6723356-Pyramimonas_sp.AAC.1